MEGDRLRDSVPARGRFGRGRCRAAVDRRGNSAVREATADVVPPPAAGGARDPHRPTLSQLALRRGTLVEREHSGRSACPVRIGITCYPTYGGSGAVATELGMAL